MEVATYFVFLFTILTISVQCTPIHRDMKEGPLQDWQIAEQKENLDDKSRFLGFLNGLNTLGGLVGSSLPIGGGNRNPSTSGGVSATTPRLNGRPGLGFIPDVTKGINTILSGVATGNLEKVLEGSFVFAPNGVQLVAGNVLDRVFMSSTLPTNASPSKVQVTTTPRGLASLEAQRQLLQIIQEQQNKINALENMKKTLK